MSFGEDLSNIPPSALAQRFEAMTSSGPSELRPPLNENDGFPDYGYRQYIGEHSGAIDQLLDAVRARAERRMPLELAAQVTSYVELAFLSLCTYVDSLNNETGDPSKNM